MLGTFVLSDFLGYASIACWLGAQFPQVLENIRRQSCEGLALPFLANWLLGDISNLVGCLLTHQLPFQTWLATYFVFIDFFLFIQYFYYYRPPAKSFSHFHARSATTPATGPRSVERGHSRYRTLSTVAGNVATAAALAAQKQEEELPPGSSRSLHLYPAHGADDSHPGLTSALAHDEDLDEDAVAALGESFYSESGRSAGRKRLAWSVERTGRAGSVGRYPRPTTPTALHALSAEVLSPHAALVTEPEEEDDAPAASARRNSRASKRGASMVFLSTWVLFGIGTLANRGLVPSSPSSTVGRLLFPSQSPVSISMAAAPQALSLRVPDTHLLFPRSIYDDMELPSADLLRANEEQGEQNPLPPRPPNEEPNYEMVLGRIFAWLCTTLYLTSRLPQIWKNYVRKSVAGLSMYLFLFAFLGNTFYVSSILLSPKAYLPPPQAAEFIRESIPYLLGSGGTLMFDITILTQSVIYRPRPKRQHNTPRLLEEEAGLLSGDDLSPRPPLSSGEAAILNRGRTARTRSLG